MGDEVGFPTTQGGGARPNHNRKSKFFQEAVLEGGPWRDDLRMLPHVQNPEEPPVRFFQVYADAPAVEDLPPATREFLNFLLSHEGQTEIARTGSLPLARTMLLRARKRLGL